MSSISGIGKKSRVKLGKVLIGCKSKLITPDRVVEILQVTQVQARKLLQHWEKSGWLCRLRRGLYQPLSLEASGLEVVVDDPWVVACKLFSPCYVGGWSAVEFWDFTEQIFQTVVVVTSRRFSQRNFKVGGVHYILKRTSQENFFGLKHIWRNNVRVQVSDPSKTMIDLLNDPLTGGGMRPIIDFFKEYLHSDHKSLKTLLEYGDKMDNRTVFKRLGFLMDTFQPQESDFINDCKNRISKGRSQFDPTIKGEHFNSKWLLLMPKGFYELDTEGH